MGPKDERAAAALPGPSPAPVAGGHQGTGGGAPGAGEEAGRRRQLPRALVVVAMVAGVVVGVAAAACWVAGLALISAHAFPGQSDDASWVLMGHALASGNPVLHGWLISLDAFWPLDTLFYAGATAVAGVVPALMHAVPTVLAFLTVSVGIAMARGGRGGLPAWGGMGACFLVIGLPVGSFAAFFLQGPQHVATTLYCLVAFAASSRAGRRWAWVAGVVVLAAAVVGDPLAMAAGVAPLGAAGVAAMLRARSWRAGGPLLGAVVATALAIGWRAALLAAGGYRTGTLLPHAPPATWPANLHGAAHLLATMVGLEPVPGVPPGLELARVASAALVAAGLVATAARLLIGVVRGLPGGGAPQATATRHTEGASRVTATRHTEGASRVTATRHTEGAGRTEGARRTAGARRPGGTLDDVLLLAFLGDVALFVVVALQPASPGYFTNLRYLLPGLVFAAVLAGRQVSAALAWAAATAPARRRRRAARGARAALGVLGGALLAVYAAGTAASLQVPLRPATDPARTLAAWLSARGLRQGFGDYWSSSITTVESNGQVLIRPVQPGPHDRLEPFAQNVCECWYGSAHPGRFVVTSPADAGQGPGVAAGARASFGPPARTYTVGNYRVMVWDHPLTVPPHRIVTRRRDYLP